MDTQFYMRQDAEMSPAEAMMEHRPASLADLPAPDTKRWVVRRKAAVVNGVRSGLLTLEQACERYDLTVEEFLSWQRLIDEQAERIAYLEEWKRLIDSKRFGSKSEKASPDQFPLFNEAEVEAAAADDDDLEEDTIAVPAHTRKKRGRRPLPEFLPVKEILHDLSDEEKVCRHDPSHRLVEIGRETSDQLKFIPATVEIVRHVRPKYACSSCKEGVAIAPMPRLPIPKSLATPSLLAQVATSKYVDGLPLYRQEKIFGKRSPNRILDYRGRIASRSTFCGSSASSSAADVAPGSTSNTWFR